MKKKFLSLIVGFILSLNFIIPVSAKTTGWVSVNKGWNYIKTDGSKTTGWYNDNGTWYYFYSDGTMATGWFQSNGKWYYMLKDGSMAVNTKVDGYYLNSNGTWSTNVPFVIYNGADIKQKLYSLGFVDKNSGMTLNPYGANGAMKFTSMEFYVLSGDDDMSLTIIQSNPQVDKKLKTILNWILPTKGNYLYSILDTDGLNSQTLELDGRTVTIKVQVYGITLDFRPIK